MKVFSKLCVCAMVLGPMVPATMAAHIDTFGDGPFRLVVDRDDDTSFDQRAHIVQENLDPDAVLGGQREVTLEFTASDNPPGATDQVSSEIDADVDQLTFSADAGESARLTLGYALGENPRNLVSSQTFESGFSSFLIAFALADKGTTVEVTVTDSNGTSDTVTKQFQEQARDRNLFIEYSAFADAVDFTSVDTLSFQLHGEPSGDYVLEQIVRSDGAIGAVIPTPAAMSIWLVAAGGAGLLRRRRGRRARS